MRPQLLNSLKGYTRSDLFKDLFAGLMVAIIALPLSIALGIQSVPESVSSNGIQFGIITAIIAGFFISALGGSRFQIGGPTAAFVVILYGYLADPEIGILGLAIAGVMAGVILIVMGFLRAGSVMKFFPYPITIGFTTGIGVTLFIGQIKDFCALDASGTEAIHKLISYVENIATFDLATFAVGLVGFLCVVLLPKLSKKIPSAFVALILCTVMTICMNSFLGTSVATIGSKYGEIEAGFFPVDISLLGSVNIGKLIVPAIVIAFLCAIESLLSATVASGMTNTTFDTNQELVGQGVANICSSLLGGLPATGAIARTAASIENGAKSPLAGMFHSVLVLVLYFALMGVVKHIPLAVFSAILMSVAINMSRFPLFMKLARFGVRDSVILFVTFILTVVFDLTYGVLGGVAVTFIMNVKSLRLGMSYTVEEGVVAVKGAIFFVNADKLVKDIESKTQDQKSVTIDLSEVESIDQTALEKLAGLRKKMVANDRALTLRGANPKTQKRIDDFYSVL